MKKISLLRFYNLPIYKQLQLEEALLHTNEKNWCIINEGTPPAIVMGIAGKKENLIDISLLKKNPLPVIKRFSGGGCVIVNNDSLFISFIFANSSPTFPLFPEKIHALMEKFYTACFNIISFKENDYVIGQKKCAGNAQYIKKNRWLHHSCFLWDFQKEQMDLLLLPSQQPKYRKNQSHEKFLCKLKDFFPSKEYFFNKIIKNLHCHFQVETISSEDFIKKQFPLHRKRTELIFIK